MNRGQSPWINFFNRPILWGWAAGTIVAIILGAIIFSPPVAKIGLLEITFNIFEEDNFTLKNIISLYLMSFGVKNVEMGISIIVQSSLTLCVVIILLSFLGVIAFTKESNSSIYILGPLLVYSIVIIIYVATDTSDSNASFIFLPTLGKLIIWLIVTGLIAKMLMKLAEKIGWIEGLDDANHNQPIKFNPPPILATVGAMVTESVKPIPTSQASGTTPKGITKIGHSANYCPYCGSDKLRKRSNACVCPACDSINFGASPVTGNTKRKCLQCEAGILQNAQFCWDCGELLANQQDVQQPEQPTEVDAEECRYCSYCGAKAPSDAKFCNRCGKALADQLESENDW